MTMMYFRLVEISFFLCCGFFIFPAFSSAQPTPTPEGCKTPSPSTSVGYCSASGGCYNVFIGRMQFNTIDNSSGCDGYADYTSFSTVIMRETAYGITVVSNIYPYPKYECDVWVDWNQNKSFYDAGERTTLSGYPDVFTGTITGPAGALLGETRLRIRLRYRTDVAEPCGYFPYGEVEDYTVAIVPLVTPSPTPCLFKVDSGDYDGDGRSDIAIFRKGSGLWAIRGITRVYFGNSGDIPASSDYDGDRTTDISVFRKSSGLWAIRDITWVYFGGSSDLPEPGDYDGDGTADMGTFRTNGLWTIRGVTRFYFGAAWTVPAPGDYNGDGTKDIGVFRASHGLWAIRGISRVYFGSTEDIIVPGDYDGDGTWDYGIFRASSGLWAIRGITRCYFGSSIDEPIPADYIGDSKDDIRIFREISGLWAIRNISRVYFGGAGDIPVTR